MAKQFTEAELATLTEQIDRALASLRPREADVLLLHFGLKDGKPYSLKEIAGMFDITSERVRQIKAKAIRKLQQPSRKKILPGTPV